jgi:hypothetical protein
VCLILQQKTAKGNNSCLTGLLLRLRANLGGVARPRGDAADELSSAPQAARRGACDTATGLYASWDGWQVRLRAPRENGDHEIFLEDGLTLQAFFEFLDTLPIKRPS